MATVYLAQDLKHDRQVAVKVLKPELAAVLGAERFVVEIKTTASLQHPHILPLFDSGSADGFLYYVMPFIDGETLRGKLDRETQLGIDEAVSIARDVASALHYAHQHGVIHRDIKPENILLHDGRPMVADFGIALAVSAAAGGRMTETGLSLGTPHYMSPEQATAEKEITARSDVYSLGSVLYEMLAGEPPHTGASAQAIIMKIVTDVARPLTQLRRSVPPNVAAAVAKSVEKLPADRFASAKEFADALTNASFTTGTETAGAASTSSSTRRAQAALPLAVALGVAVVVGAWGWMKGAPPAPVVRLALTLPDSASLQQQAGTLFDISDDGEMFVYTGPGPGDVDLWMRPVSSLDASPVPSTNGADSPFLAPDGSAVVFYRGNPPALYLVSLRGGPRRTLAEGNTVALGGDFGPDGHVYFSRRNGLNRVAIAGGEIEQLTARDTAGPDAAHGWADVLPNGRGLIFTVLRTPDALSDIAVLDLKSREVRILLRGVMGRYSPSGHLVYSDAAGGLFAIAFDQKRMTTSGAPIPLARSVTRAGDAVAHFALSATGRLVYGTGISSALHQLEWVDRQGRTAAVDTAFGGTLDALALSPDGRRLAITRVEDEPSVWIKELDQGPAVKLTLQVAAWDPSWTPDGRRVLYSAGPPGRRALLSRRSDGSGGDTVLFREVTGLASGSLSPDGQWYVFEAATQGGASSGRDIVARRVTGDTTPIPIAISTAQELSPRLSPNGRWLAFVSNETGRLEVYVVPFPNAADGRTLVSVNGGTEPLWSRDGRELFYTGTANRLTSARVELSPTFRVVSRTTLFDRSAYNRAAFGGPMYDVSPDGQRFIMSRRTGSDSENLVMVLNWFEELQARK